MKIVCLIRPDPPLLYFANRINSDHQVALVVLEKPKVTPSNLLTKVKKHGIGQSVSIIKNRVFNKSRRIANYNTFFNTAWQTLDKDIPHLYVDSINSKVVHDRLKEIEPDLIVDHGTSLVKDHILETSKLALNLHWGLSPYYRGTHCTEWALINWDPRNIGVTIHKLTKDIDGGSILAQKRAVIKPDDTLHSINMQLTYLGTELITEAIGRLKNGENLRFEKQDFSLGYLTYLRQWNHVLDKEIEYIEKNNLIDVMLKKPSREMELPIIEMK